jgi:carbamoyl-phosphate synthase large subunit
VIPDPPPPPAAAGTAAVGHVLVSSAAKKAPLVLSVASAARRIHPQMQVFAGDIDPAALTRYVADQFWEMPPTVDDMLECIVAGCRDRAIRVVVPTRDAELAFWARHGAALRSAGIAVIVSDAASIEQCIDKLAFAAFGRQHGLPVIPASADIAELSAGRYVVKERFGAGSTRIGVDLDTAAAVAHAAHLTHPIFQRCIYGREISADSWLDRHHRVKGVVLRWREVIEHGESQVTTTFRDARLEAEVVRVLEALRLRGPVVLQAIVDAQAQLHVIEVNARFGGASTSGIAAGLDPWYWSLLESQGVDVDACRFSRCPGEVRQVRLPTDVVLHVPHL